MALFSSSTLHSYNTMLLNLYKVPYSHQIFMTQIAFKIEKVTNLYYKNIHINNALKKMHTVRLPKFGIVSRFYLREFCCQFSLKKMFLICPLIMALAEKYLIDFFFLFDFHHYMLIS